MERCPTCSKPLRATYTDQALAAMAAAGGRPLSSRELVQITGATSPTIYTMVRRLADRGVIRKVLVSGVSGWVIAPKDEVEMPHPSPSSDAIRAAQSHLVREIQQFRLFTLPDALQFLQSDLGVGEDGARLVLDALVRNGRVEINGEAVSA